MRVPINPQTRVSQGQLGYGQNHDVSSGIRAIGQVVRAYADDLDKENKKRELFDVQRLLVDETNSLQTEFETRKTAAPLGAPKFTEQLNYDYTARHKELADTLRQQGFSEDAVNEYETRLGTIRAQYVAQAIDFQDKSGFAKTRIDTRNFATSLSQYANRTPSAVQSALDELRVGLTHSTLDAVEQEQVYQEDSQIILQGAREGFVQQHPEAVLQLYGVPNELKTETNQATGELVNLGEAQKTVSTALTNAGMNPNVVAGFLGNFHVEGGYTGKTGDGGSAAGIAQLRGERRDNFKAMFGKDASQATIAENAKFVVWEMQNPKKAGMTVAQRDAILKADSPQKAAELIDKYYERSSGADRQKRIDAAVSFVGEHADNTTAALQTNPTSDATVDTSGKTGIPILDLSTGPQRMDMLVQARSIMNERNAEAKSAQQQAHAAWLNNFYNQLEDGKLGQADLNAAYTSGQLTDFDERNKAQGILDSKNKKDDDIVLFGAMLNSSVKGNPYDKKQQDAVDAGFEAGIKDIVKNNKNISPFDYALHLWQRTGIIPKQGAVMLRGALVSTDQNQVAGAASVANNMIKQKPNAFAGVEGQAEIEHAAVAYGHYIYDLGMAPAAAAQRIATENDPKFKEKFKYNDPATQEILKTLRQTGVNAKQAFKGADFPNQDALNEGNQTYYELLRDNLNRGLGYPEANAQATAQMQKVYGVNSNGRIIKYPPERAYPQINGSWSYIYHDAQDTVKAETGRDPIKVNLVPIPGVTDEDFRTGKLARYRIVYSYKINDQTVIDSVPGQFAADVSVANQRAREENRENFVKARKAQVDRPPLVLPGIGPVR